MDFLLFGDSVFAPSVSEHRIEDLTLEPLLLLTRCSSTAITSLLRASLLAL